MGNNQAKLVLALGKKIKVEKRDKAEVISTFRLAGILDKNNQISKNYSAIKQAVELSKTE